MIRILVKNYVISKFLWDFSRILIRILVATWLWNSSGVRWPRNFNKILQYFDQNYVIGLTNILIRKLDDHWILPIFQSENYMTTEFLWNVSSDQYSDQKIRWLRNSSRISHTPIRKLGDPVILMKLRNSSRIRWPKNSYIRFLLEFFKN